MNSSDIWQWMRNSGREVAVVFFFFGILLTLSLFRRGFLMARGKQLSVSARLVSKEETAGGYQAVFEANGLILRFSIKKEQFQNLEQGRRGRLVYRGGAFLSFITKNGKSLP